MIKSIIFVVDTIAVQNVLAPFCCILGKNHLQHFLLFSSLGKEFQISVTSLIKTKQSNKNFQPNSSIVASLKASKGKAFFTSKKINTEMK